MTEEKRIRELVHELQVHQAELEIQKENLRQSQMELDASHNRYRKLFDFTPVACLTLDKNLHILEVNQAGIELLGRAKHQLLKNNFTRYVSPESQDMFYLLQKQAFAGHNRLTGEISLLDGSSIWARVALQAEKEEDRLRIAITDITQNRQRAKVTRDITERKNAEQGLRVAKDDLEERVFQRTAELAETNAKLTWEVNIRQQMEESLRRSDRFNAGLLENAPNPISVVNADYSIYYVNKALENLTGYTSSELMGKKAPFPWWPEGKKAQYLRSFKKDAANDSFHRERLFCKKNGKPFWAEITSTTLRDADGEAINHIMVWLDVTERKKAEEQLLAYQQELRLLNSQLTLAEQNERRNIATQIHGGVTQLLALSGMKLEVLMNSASGTSLAVSLNEIYKIIQQAIEDTRSLTFELSPPSLYDLGLETAVEELTEEFGEKHKLKATFESDGKTKDLDESTSVLLFQAVRELLNNVARHAQAHRVDVSVEKVKKFIRITILDDGVGFKTTLKEKRNHAKEVGLFSIRERFHYIGGHLHVESRPGKGTCATLIAPLKAEKKK